MEAKKHIIVVFVFFFLLGGLCWAQETDTSEGAKQAPASETSQEKGFLDSLTEALGEAAKETLEEKVEDWKKNYRGRITAVKVVEEDAQHVTLEVSYKRVSRPDDVYISGEVLRRGSPSPDFVVDRLPLTKKRGVIRLNVYYVEPETQDVRVGRSDQIVVYLHPAGEPDKRFGEYYLTLVKKWGLEETKEASGEEAITLTDEEESSGEREGKDLSLAPVTDVKTGTKEASSSFPTRQIGSVARLSIPSVKNYDFYTQAHRAKWRSSRGTLPFPGRDNDQRGFVRRIPQGFLSTGNKAVRLLETHPAWERAGWIEGEYPLMVLGPKVHFKAVAGFLKGVKASDGAVFKVLIKDQKGRKRLLISRFVPANRYVHLEADLSRYAGKAVSIILYVNSWRTSAQDWAVWVAPRLTTK